MTNIGPLTTTLTPASGCLQTIWGQVYTDYQGSNSTTYKYHSLGRSATSECYPNGFQVKSDAYYSPGVCPSGWASACGTLEVIGTVTETRATCCPRGYSCMATQGPEVAWSTLSCTSGAISSVAVIVPYVDNQQEMTTTLSRILVEAAAVNIRWQKTDFLPAATTSATPTNTTPGETSSGIATGPSVPEIGTSTLSTYAKAGIGIGTAVGVMLVLGTIAFLLYRRRKHRKLVDGTEDRTKGNNEVRDAAPGRNPSEVHLGQEVHGQSHLEMPTRANMLEMNGHSGPTELNAWERVELESK